MMERSPTETRRQFIKGGASALAIAAVLFAATAHADTTFARKAGCAWQDGLLIGDGATASLAYAPAHLEWIINRNDVFDSRVSTCDYMPHGKVMECVATNKGHSVMFLDGRELHTIRGREDGPLGRTMSAAILRVRFWGGSDWAMPSIPQAAQSLDTQTGELVERMESPSFDFEAVSFVERSRDVMAVQAGDRVTKGRRLYVDLVQLDDPRCAERPPVWKVEDGAVCFSQRMPGGEMYAVAMTATGAVKTVGRTASFVTAGGETLFVAVRTTRDAKDPVAAACGAVRAAAHDGFEKVRSDNSAWWRGFWERGARATFASEPAIDTQWHYSLYALASQYGAAPMPALNGLSYGPPGDGAGGVGCNCYVHDQNVQIPMMPFFPLGHAEFVSTFVKTYEDAMPEIERRTREWFGVSGACLPINMSLDGKEEPVASYRYTLCGSAYSGLVLAQAWWYSHDEEILKAVYPLLKKFIRFYTETMTRDADGTCHFLWSVPPEIFAGTRDDTATIACLKPCLEVALEAATRFGCDAEDAALWKDVLAHYPRIAKHPDGGWWCGPEIPHDHYMYGGHLFYPFFPAESDTDRDTARKTLDYTFKYAVEISHETAPPHPVHEWSALYTGMAKTRLFGGADGWKALADFYDAFAKPNGLFSHNPVIVTDLTREQIAENLKKAGPLRRRNYYGEVVDFSRKGPNDLVCDSASKKYAAPVLEGGAAFLMLASEALCQSWDGTIRLFPSVPENFTGKFENFRVRGGYSVSAEMKDGRLVDYLVKGGKGADGIRVVHPPAVASRSTGASVASFCERAEKGGRLTVAFLGGSLSWGANATDPNRASWRAKVGEKLERRYPDAHFKFVDAAIGGTDSQLGIFRLERDVIAYKPDLVFVEWLVNDGTRSAGDNRSCSYEGIIRHLLERLPRCVPVQVLLPVRATIEEQDAAKLLRWDEQRRTGAAYGLVCADVLGVMRRRYADGKADLDRMWPALIGDNVHPHDFGYGVYADIIWEKAFANPSSQSPKLTAEWLFAPKYRHVVRENVAEWKKMPRGWRRDFCSMRAETFDFLCSRWQDGLAVAANCAYNPRTRKRELLPDAVVEPLRAVFQGEVLFIYGETTGQSSRCEVYVDGVRVAQRDTGKMFGTVPVPSSAYLDWQVGSDFDADREHALEIRPVFDDGEPQEFRLGSICVAGRNAAWVRPEVILSASDATKGSQYEKPTGELQEKAQALADLAVKEGMQGALQFCAYKDGKCIVDVWAGTMTTNAGAAKIDGDTLFPIFSTEKPLLATAVHRSVEQGKLEYDRPVSDYWPEFKGGGKERLTPRLLLAYRSGLPDNKPGAGTDVRTLAWMADWNGMLDWYASCEPEIEPGTKQRYMPKSYGWALGGLLEKAWGRSANDILREQVLVPAGIENDFFFVCGDDEIARIATAYNSKAFETMNNDVARRSLLPSSWAVSSARGIAKFYNRLCGFDGKPPLVARETLDEALKPCRHESDPVPDVEGLKKWHMIFGMGYGLWGEADDLSRVFGHGGVGGSEGLCDRSQRLVVGYTCNFDDAPPKLREAFYSLVGIRWRYWKDDINIQDLQMATVAKGNETPAEDRGAWFNGAKRAKRVRPDYHSK